MRTRRTQLRAYFLFCKAYDLPAFPVTEQVYWLYLAFLVGSFSSYNSVNNYLSCLKQVNLYLGADVTFFASSQINFLKQAAKRVLAKPVGRKLPITVDILLAIFKLLDFRHPLHVCMWTIFLVAFFSLLRKSNLVPTTIADVTSASATQEFAMLAFIKTTVHSMYTKPKLFSLGRGPLKLFCHSSLTQCYVLFPH